MGARSRSARSVSSALIRASRNDRRLVAGLLRADSNCFLIAVKKNEVPPVTRSLTISSNDWRLTALLNCFWKSGEEQMPS